MSRIARLPRAESEDSNTMSASNAGGPEIVMPFSVKIVSFRFVLESRGIDHRHGDAPPGLFSGSKSAGPDPDGLLHRIGELGSNRIVKLSSSSWIFV